jgi:hypothetical protein
VKTFRMMLCMTTLAGGILYSIPQSAAQSLIPPETLQAAGDLAALLSGGTMSDLTTKTIDESWPSMEAALRSKTPNLDAATVGQLRGEYNQLIVNATKEIMSEAPNLYARHFTAQEMRDIVAFYRTPTGAKVLSVMPQVATEFLAMLTPRLQGVGEKVNLAFLIILQKRGYYAK